MALNLMEAAKGVQHPVKRGLIETFAQSTEIFGWLPMETITTGTHKYLQEQVLPTVNFRGINEDYATVTGVINPKVEVTARMGDDVETDLKLIQLNGEDVHSRNVAMLTKAIGHKYFYHLFQGDTATASDSFDGLLKRVPVGAGQAFENTGASDALSLDSLNAMLDGVEGPNQVLVMLKATRRKLTAASSNASLAGYITRSVDSFGRQIELYAGRPIIAADPLGVNSAALDTSETGTAADTSSIFCLSLGDGHVWGMQTANIDSRELGESHDGPRKKTRVDWDAGLVIEHPRAVGRLYNVKPTLAVVA